MNATILDLYKLPNIHHFEDISLLTLSEHCAILEQRVLNIAQSLPPSDQQIIEDFIHTRDDLEEETVKTALRLGKRHYK